MYFSKKTFDSVLQDYNLLISHGNIELDKMNPEYAERCFNEAEDLKVELLKLSDVENYQQLIFLAKEGIVDEEFLLNSLIKRKNKEQ